MIPELTSKSNLQLISQFKFDINGNPFKVMTENNLDSVKTVPADIEFTLSNYKPKIPDAIVKIRDSKKFSGLDSIFHDIARNEAWNIDKFFSLNWLIQM